MPGQYTVLAYDLMSNTQVGELPVTGISWEDTLNRAGGFQTALPLRSEIATVANIDTWRTAIFVDRDGVLLYGGIVTKADVSADDTATLAISGTGFFGYYRGGDNRRTIRSRQGMSYAAGSGSEVRFTAVDQFRIVSDLIAHGNFFTGGNIGLAVQMHGPSGGLSGVTRDRSYYGYERKTIGEAIEQLAEVNGGFDFSTTVQWSGNTPTRILHLWYPRVGRSVDLVLEQNKNITSLSYSRDGEGQANDVTATGSGDGDKMLTAQSFNINRVYPTAPYPLLEAVTAYRDVNRRSTLNLHAQADRLELQTPVETMSMSIIDTEDVPLGSYIVGDDILVITDDNYIPNDRYRIQSLKVEIDEDGHETIGLDLATLTASLRRGD